MLTFLGLSVDRWLDDRLLLLSGTADNPSLDGHAPTVVSDLDVYVLFLDTRQLGFDYIRVTLLRDVNGGAQSTLSHAKERVVEYRVAPRIASGRGPAKERILEHPEEWAELAEEVTTEGHLVASGGVGLSLS